MVTGENTGLLPPSPKNSSVTTVPDEPLFKIRPAGSWAAVAGVGELWAHRELFYFLVWRDLKVRYRQTILGAGWVVLQPLLTTLVFTVFLGQLVRVPAGDAAPYPLFAYSGLLLWTFFSNAVSSAGYSLVASAPVITKVYFARMIVPSAAVAVRLVDFVIGSLILVALMAYYGVSGAWGLLALPVIVAELALLALAIGAWVSALNVRYRDVGTMLPVLLQLWMFASPIVYPSSLVPESWRWLYSLNPVVGVADGFRAALFGLRFDWPGLGLSAAVTLVLFVYSVRAFRRMEETFADVV